MAGLRAAKAAKQQSSCPSVATRPQNAEECWTFESYLSSEDVASVLAEAILHGAAGTKSGVGAEDDQFETVRSLTQKLDTVEKFAEHLRGIDIAGKVASFLLPKLLGMYASDVGSGDAALSKFTGAIEMQYGTLDTFFNGLEGLVGPPHVKVHEGMLADHTNGPESNDTFTTGNYGISTTAETEWYFVVEPNGRKDWPEESDKKLVHLRHRKPQPLHNFDSELKKKNEELEKAKQALIIPEEVIAARLYTGPMFVKYNAVLRGSFSSAVPMRNAMILFCCSKADAEAYMGMDIAKAWCALCDIPKGSMSFDEAMRSCNFYTTTLHAINSAIVKMSRLTKATKVYRGIFGRSLPKEFWTPNEYDIMGGIEGAFMSTTLQRSVAMGYAKGGGGSSGSGIVFEIQQGMVNRGANVGWLSQYPHEEEILFGPLSGIEVQRKRVDGSIVVIEAVLNINLNAQTLEQVISKRRKIMIQMCENLRAELDRELRSEPWAALIKEVGDLDLRLPAVVRKQAEEKLDLIIEHPAEDFNEDKNLQAWIEAALSACAGARLQSAEVLYAAAKNLEPKEAEKVREMADDFFKDESVLRSVTLPKFQRDSWSKGGLLTQLGLRVDDDHPDRLVIAQTNVYERTMEFKKTDEHILSRINHDLAEGEEPFMPGLRLVEINGHHSELQDVIKGLKEDNFPEGKLSLVFSRCRTESEVCARVVEIGLESIDLSVRALRISRLLALHPQATKLDLKAKELGPEGGMAVINALKSNHTVTSLNLGANKIGDECGTALANNLVLSSSLASLDLWGNDLSDATGMEIAKAMRHSMTTLQSLMLGGNRFGKATVEAIRKAVDASERERPGPKIGKARSVVIKF